MLTKITGIYRTYPSTFWTLVGATFIDRLGGALIFPFFSLYVTEHFQVGMTEVGILFTIFSITSLFGSFIGGAMTDKFGRRSMLLFGLIISALSALAMGFVDQLTLFYALAAVVGLLSNTGGPAQQAMVADLLPERQRTEGFGIIRVVMNLAVAIGPAIGGLLASQSYLLLFILDAVLSLITAGIVFAIIPETRPANIRGETEESMVESIGGYGRVLRDRWFMAYVIVSTLMVTIYMQMNSTLSVYLRDEHGVPIQGFGWILSLNAAMVVLFQFWVTRRISGRPPMRMMAFGASFYAIGFAMYGFVSWYPYFLLAMVIITIGEMIVSPVGQALVAQFAPEDMRGRYMAMYGFSWLVPSALGPLAAGIIMDYYNPNWVWYLSGVLGLVVVAGYAYLDIRSGPRLQPAIQAVTSEPATPSD